MLKPKLSEGDFGSNKARRKFFRRTEQEQDKDRSFFGRIVFNTLRNREINYGGELREPNFSRLFDKVWSHISPMMPMNAIKFLSEQVLRLYLESTRNMKLAVNYELNRIRNCFIMFHNDYKSLLIHLSFLDYRLSMIEKEVIKIRSAYETKQPMLYAHEDIIDRFIRTMVRKNTLFFSDPKSRDHIVNQLREKRRMHDLYIQWVDSIKKKGKLPNYNRIPEKYIIEFRRIYREICDRQRAGSTFEGEITGENSILDSRRSRRVYGKVPLHKDKKWCYSFIKAELCPENCNECRLGFDLSKPPDPYNDTEIPAVRNVNSLSGTNVRVRDAETGIPGTVNKL